MIDFATIETGIAEWTQAVVSLPVYWQGRRKPMLAKLPAYVELQIDPVAGQGVDEVRHTESGSDLVPTVAGLRQITVACRVRSRSQAPNKSARYYLEVLRSSLRKPTTLEHFQAYGLAIVRAEPTVNFDATFDERVESVAAFDLVLGLAVNDADSSIGTIDEVVITSHVEDAEGELPSPPNFDDEVIP